MKTKFGGLNEIIFAIACIICDRKIFGTGIGKDDWLGYEELKKQRDQWRLIAEELANVLESYDKECSCLPGTRPDPALEKYKKAKDEY